MVMILKNYRLNQNMSQVGHGNGKVHMVMMSFLKMRPPLNISRCMQISVQEASRVLDPLLRLLEIKYEEL